MTVRSRFFRVDYTNPLMREEGMTRFKAMIRAGRTRLRPILMTSFALIRT